MQQPTFKETAVAAPGISDDKGVKANRIPVSILETVPEMTELLKIRDPRECVGRPRRPRGGISLAATLAIVCNAVASATVAEFEHNADQWIAAVGNFEPRAFDEFVSSSGQGCIALPVGTTVPLHLDGGTVLVYSTNVLGQPDCAILDGASGQSDGFMVGPIGGNAPITLSLEFEPPIVAFFGFYGSLQLDRIVTMTVRDTEGKVIEALAGPPGPVGDVLAIGHGFTSVSPVGRIDFQTTENLGNGTTLLGAFVGLAKGEPSLGAVELPPGSGNFVLNDFAVAWSVPCPADIYEPHNYAVDVDDMLVVINFWGDPGAFGGIADLNDDGYVNVDDLLTVINAWGPCQ